MMREETEELRRMSEKPEKFETPEKLVDYAVNCTKRGAFIDILAIQQREKRFTLVDLAESPDWVGLTSRAVLAETYDQLGRYDQSAPLVTLQRAREQLKELKKELTHETLNKITEARAKVILQSGISEFRREQGKRTSLDLLDESMEIINKYPQEAIGQSVRTLFRFWHGRIHTAQYRFPEADVDLEKALPMLDRDLAVQLQDVGHLSPTEISDRVAAGNYLLYAVLGFGFGHLRQLQGKLDDSLLYLRIAVPLSRASVDYHRRGYVHLLLGTALRSRSQRDREKDDFESALEHLNEARRLFGGLEESGSSLNEIPKHHLHLSRTYHQLALFQYNRIPPGSVHREGELEPKMREYLLEGKSNNDKAKTESKDSSCDTFRDPVLDYGILVVGSLIATALGNEPDARKSYEDALQLIRDRALPRWLHGWAWVAKGTALSKNLKKSSDERDIREAEAAFQQAFQDTDVRATDRAAAYLQLSLLHYDLDNIHKASFYYEQARPLVEASEHGWTRELANRASKNLSDALPYQCVFDIKELSNQAKAAGEPPWPYISQALELRIRDLLLSLYKPDSPNSAKPVLEDVARDIGVGTATLYKWLEKSELRHYFIRSGRGGR